MSAQRSWVGDFARAWAILGLAYVTLRFSFNLIAFGWIDLRQATLVEMLVIPLGQTLAFLAVTRR